MLRAAADAGTQPSQSGKRHCSGSWETVGTGRAADFAGTAVRGAGA